MKVIQIINIHISKLHNCIQKFNYLTLNYKGKKSLNKFTRIISKCGSQFVFWRKRNRFFVASLWGYDSMMILWWSSHEDLCSDAEEMGSLEQVYEGIPATPDFISPNFPGTDHQKHFHLCAIVTHCIIILYFLMLKGWKFAYSNGWCVRKSRE